MPAPGSLIHLSLREMARQVQEGRITPKDLISEHLAHIERENPRLNAFVRVLADEARYAAHYGTPPGPLRGVPVTIKDSFDMAGLPTLCGSKLRKNHCAQRDATAVARLRVAGAIPIGKTNCPEMLWNYETDNHVTGRTNHPGDITLTPGGSSGGESAAIAGHCSPGGMGSDGGGSIRIPAHFCGIAGLKPTPGRISGAGHYPEIGYPGGLLGVVGPMARSVDDVKLLFECLAGPDDLDPFSAPVPVRPASAAQARIGVSDQFYSFPVADEIRDAVHTAATALRDAGLTVEPYLPRGLERAPELWWFFFGQLPAPFVADLLGAYVAEAHWTVTDFLRRGLERAAIEGREVVERLAQRDAMRRNLLRQMRDYPVLLLPPCSLTAFPHRTPYDPLVHMAPAVFANVLGLPALVVPVTDRAGVQLVGRPWEEELLLEVGCALERVLPHAQTRAQ